MSSGIATWWKNSMKLSQVLRFRVWGYIKSNLMYVLDLKLRHLPENRDGWPWTTRQTDRLQGTQCTRHLQQLMIVTWRKSNKSESLKKKWDDGSANASEKRKYAENESWPRVNESRWTTRLVPTLPSFWKWVMAESRQACSVVRRRLFLSGFRSCHLFDKCKALKVLGRQAPTCLLFLHLPTFPSDFHRLSRCRIHVRVAQTRKSL